MHRFAVFQRSFTRSLMLPPDRARLGRRAAAGAESGRSGCSEPCAGARLLGVDPEGLVVGDAVEGVGLDGAAPHAPATARRSSRPSGMRALHHASPLVVPSVTKSPSPTERSMNEATASRAAGFARGDAQVVHEEGERAAGPPRGALVRRHGGGLGGGLRLSRDERLELRDLLGAAVLREHEVLAGETRRRTAPGIDHHRVDRDQVHSGREGGRRGLLAVARGGLDAGGPGGTPEADEGDAGDRGRRDHSGTFVQANRRRRYHERPSFRFWAPRPSYTPGP